MSNEERKYLKRGEIAVNRKSLSDHCACFSKALDDMDIVMKEKDSFERGKKIALIMNRINFTNHTIQHFMLDIPLKKLK